MRALLRVSVIVMLTVLGLILAWQFRTVIALFVLALLLTSTFRPLIARLRQVGIPASLSMVVIYLVLLALVAGMAIALFPVIAQEINQLTQDLGQAYGQWYDRLTANVTWKEAVSSRLPSPDAFLSAIPAANRDAVTRVVVGTTMTVVDIVTQGLLMLFLSVYLAADELRFERLWLSLISPTRRTLARQIVHDAEDSIGAYLRSELTQSLFVFIVFYALASVIGLKYALIGAILVAVVWTIPIVGGMLALAWVAFAGLLTGWQVVIPALAATAALLAFTEFWLQPRLYRRDRFGSILVLMMMLLLGNVYGLVGLLAAPPLATAVQVALNGSLQAPTSPRMNELPDIQPAPLTPAPPEETAWEELAKKLTDLQQIASETNLQPSTQHLLEKLKGLLEQTRAELKKN